MTDSTLKKDVSRYFDVRLRDAGSIAFDEVADNSTNTWKAPAVVITIAIIGVAIWLWPSQTPTLADELMVTTSWQSDTDVFLDYQGRHFLYELPDLEIL